MAVIGGGWAGLAAAVNATRHGHRVTLYEMAAHLGGRAREVSHNGFALDNGQHILIGAYGETLRMMALVGADVDALLLRMPLRVTYPDGKGLRLPSGPPMLAFAWAVLNYPDWCWSEKLSLLRTATQWVARRFRCDGSLTVAQLTGHLPPAVREELLDPLCVAALNTPATQASASVFLRVLRDALFSGPGSADLLLPRRRLSALWPDPAARWLQANGAMLRISHRVERLLPDGTSWQVDGEPFDGVVLACTAVEAVRLTQSCAPGWSAQAHALHYEPIVTVYACSLGARLPEPMMALYSADAEPAQFVFDLGQIAGLDSILAFVISGAAPWVARGTETTVNATLTQGRKALGQYLVAPLEALRVTTEKRATFLCTPALHRPAMRVLPGLWAAGDYVAGPYPATLEGAIRAGLAASDAMA